MMAATVQSPPTSATHRTMYIHRFQRDYGPLVVDDWEASAPSGDPPVLLIHGWGGTGSYWRDTALKLSETVRVIVPDLPGTGRSQPVKSARDMFDQVKTLIDILDTLEIDRVQLVGHSMGGAMAVLLADRCPDRVERIALASLTFFKTEHQKQVYRNVMTGFKLFLRLRAKWMASIPGGTQMMARQYFYRVPKDNPMLKRGLQDFLELDTDTAMACANDATSEAIPEAGSRLHVPVLLIACRNDQMMPMENVDFTQDIIAECRVHWMEECGHLPMVEKPKEFLATLRGFLRLGELAQSQPST